MTDPGHDAMGGDEGETTDGHLEHEERKVLGVRDVESLHCLWNPRLDVDKPHDL